MYEFPSDYMHCIAIDYHTSRTPWSVIWMAISPTNEWFVWQEFHPAIDGANAYSTYDIAKTILRRSMDYQYSVCLIDPLANTKQANTNTNTTEDLNLYLHQIRAERGLGTPMYFQGWDTKGTKGRDQIGMRFKNAVRCQKPFNNGIKENNTLKRLPTIWISHECPKVNRSILNWSYGEYVTASVKAVNDPKPEPKQKNSHDPMCLEAMAKDIRVLHAGYLISHPPKQIRGKNRSITGR